VVDEQPWLDRYDREPHDIYLPLALARLNGNARVTRPAYLEFLTIDNSFGRMPEQVPNEVTPHLLSAMDEFSDAPGLVTWIYPFDEYHDMTFGREPRLQDVFFGDWFLRGAVNNGFPLNSVVSTRQFAASFAANPAFYRDTILLAYAPVANGKLEELLMDALRRGISVLLYGPTDKLGDKLRHALHLKNTDPLSGELTLKHVLEPDVLQHGTQPSTLNHRDIISGGPINTVVEQAAPTRVCATVSKGSTERVVAASLRPSPGASTGTLGWVRGSFCCSLNGGRLPTPDNPERYFHAETLMRLILSEFGYSIRFSKPGPQTRSPLLLASRHRNGCYLSCYSPATTASVRLRFPHGAPVPVGTETWIENGHTSYNPPRSWHKEVRCFVDQTASGELSCVEGISEYPFIKRRMILHGLKDATVTFLPEGERRVIMAVNDLRTYNQNSVPYRREDSGTRYVARDVTGTLSISW
jgi:hypothetical protein